MIKITLILLIMIGLSAGLVLGLFGALWIIGRIRKREYEHDYIFLAASVRYWAVSEQTYHKIVRMFTELTLSKGNDPERTQALWEEFKDRFNVYYKKSIE